MLGLSHLGWQLSFDLIVFEPNQWRYWLCMLALSVHALKGQMSSEHILLCLFSCHYKLDLKFEKNPVMDSTDIACAR